MNKHFYTYCICMNISLNFNLEVNKFTFTYFFYSHLKTFLLILEKVRETESVRNIYVRENPAWVLINWLSLVCVLTGD